MSPEPATSMPTPDPALKCSRCGKMSGDIYLVRTTGGQLLWLCVPCRRLVDLAVEEDIT